MARSADDQVERAIAVGQRPPERCLVDPHLACRRLPCQVHHDRAGIKCSDLGPTLQQFAQVQARAACCVQHTQAGDGPERGQHRRAVVMGVVRAVRRMLLKDRAHRVVGIPQVLTHTDTMTCVSDAAWPWLTCWLSWDSMRIGEECDGARQRPISGSLPRASPVQVDAQTRVVRPPPRQVLL